MSYNFYIHGLSTLDEPSREMLRCVLGDTQTVREDQVEVGPRKGISLPPWSSNVRAIFNKVGISNLTVIRTRIESRENPSYDFMTEALYSDGFDLDDFIQDYDAEICDPEKFLKADVDQSSSEHCRHHFFRGHFRNLKTGKVTTKTLFDWIKEPLDALKKTSDSSLVAFSDNSSVIRGFNGLHFLLTAETHNFPSGVAPFEGGATGTGGRLRDVQATGRGALVGGGIAGFCVGSIAKDPLFDEHTVRTPKDILIHSSTGVFDYANKFGEPLLCVFGRSGNHLDGEGRLRSWSKPIVFTAGVGTIYEENLEKKPLEPGDLIAKIGGPAYRIGVGGGAASSKGLASTDLQENLQAVQRGDPAVEKRMDRVIQAFGNMRGDNPIKSIHDQGAGGNANVLREMAEGCGVEFDLSAITLGETMGDTDLWIAEYQESNAIGFSADDLPLVKRECEKEGVTLDVVGTILSTSDSFFVRRGPRVILENSKDVPWAPTTYDYLPFKSPPLGEILVYPKVPFIFGNEVDYGSKHFLTVKADRSVGGRVVLQPCIGPFHFPLGECGILASHMSPTEFTGVATAVGEQPIVGLNEPSLLAWGSLGEAILRLASAKVGSIKDVRASANWMWCQPKVYPDEAGRMLYAMESLVDAAKEIGLAFDGGKDSLSMEVREGGKTVRAPGSLVVTVYGAMEDVRRHLTPDLKPVEGSIIGFFETPTPGDVLWVFEWVQEVMSDLLAGHVVNDKGFPLSVFEMAIGGGVAVDFDCFVKGHGYLIQVSPTFVLPPSCMVVGRVIDGQVCHFTYEGMTHHRSLESLRRDWHKTAFRLDLLQAEESCVIAEASLVESQRRPPAYTLPLLIRSFRDEDSHFEKALVLREDGTNGDYELVKAFEFAGFEARTATAKQLEELELSTYKVLAFAGGFSFSDVLGGARGWEICLRENPEVWKKLVEFYERDDTLSIGICNGAQLMCRLGDLTGLKGAHLEQNTSKRFESRFPTVKVVGKYSVWFEHLEGHCLGIWSAHGEGRFTFDRDFEGKAALFYANDGGEVTDAYPFCPNGSEGGVAAISDQTGRHLAIMPHPERSVLKTQWPWMPSSYSDEEPYAPWIQMFFNANKF